MTFSLARTVLTLTLILSNLAPAQVHFVDASAAPGGDGSAWTTAFASLQDAILVAQPGEQVWVAEGRYTPDVGVGIALGDRLAAFDLPSGVQFYGGFLGSESSLTSRSGLTANTVLTGDLAGDDLPDGNGGKENSMHVLRASGASATTRIEGFVIEGGNANGVGVDGTGGGILLTLGSNLRVKDCVIRKNRAALDGGAVISEGNSNPVFEECSFEDNFAGMDGGAFKCVSDCAPLLIRCVFNGNRAGRFGGAAGNSGSALPSFFECIFVANESANSAGAIWCDNAAIEIDDCTFTRNQAAALGGAIFCTGSPVMRSCDFIENDAQRGGAIYVLAVFSNPVLTDCSFEGNTATLEGGAMFSSGNPTLESCLFESNSTPGEGGAVRTAGSGKEPTFVECVFTSNTASRGGAVSNSGIGKSEFERCSFRFNRAIEWGGAVSHGEAVLVMRDCKIIENLSLLKGGGVVMHNLPGGSLLEGCEFRNCRASERGGGLYITNSSSPTVTNCTFRNNISGIHGGGVYNISSEAAGGVSNGRFEGCTFDTNIAGVDGGGFFNSTSPTGGESNPVVIDCLFTKNSAWEDGGGFHNVAYGGLSAPTLLGVEFLGNYSGRDGGGVHNLAYTPAIGSSSSLPSLVNCVFSGNGAWRYGGGFSNDSNSVSEAGRNTELIGCVFSENRAFVRGGGVFDSYPNTAQSQLSLRNSILWGNVAIGIVTEASQLDDLDGDVLVEYSCIQGLTTAGIGSVSTNPIFLDARGPDNVAGTCDDNLCLATSSPLIDAGNNAAVPPDAYDLDQDLDQMELLPFAFGRTARFVDSSTPDTGAGGAPIVDMGPYEGSDCDSNGINDAEDVFLGAEDCNGNHVPDICELPVASGGLCTSGCSSDTNGNGVLDECEPVSPTCAGSDSPRERREGGKRRPSRNRKL